MGLIGKVPRRFCGLHRLHSVQIVTTSNCPQTPAQALSLSSGLVMSARGRALNMYLSRMTPITWSITAAPVAFSIVQAAENESSPHRGGGILGSRPAGAPCTPLLCWAQRSSPGLPAVS